MKALIVRNLAKGSFPFPHLIFWWTSVICSEIKLKKLWLRIIWKQQNWKNLV